MKTMRRKGVRCPLALTIRDVSHTDLMFKIATIDNLRISFKSINKKAVPGIDRVKAEKFAENLDNHVCTISVQLMLGIYKPNLLKRVFIPKKNSPGEKRTISIPTTSDKLVQASIVNVLMPLYAPLFSENSFGVIKGKGTFEALKRVLECANEGYGYAVKLDIKKFFDTVNHEKLMYYLSLDISNTELLRLIYSFLRSQAVERKKVVDVNEGLPQGGPLSPLLSNVYLNQLDQLLEQMDCKFTRYVDDCIILTKTKEEADIIFDKVKLFIEAELKLNVNMDKSYIKPFEDIEFLGYCFKAADGKYMYGLNRIKFKELKRKIADIIDRMYLNFDMNMVITSLNNIRFGWVAFYGRAELEKEMNYLDKLIFNMVKKKHQIIQKHRDADNNVICQVLDDYKGDEAFEIICDYMMETVHLNNYGSEGYYRRNLINEGFKPSIDIYNKVRQKWAKKNNGGIKQ